MNLYDEFFKMIEKNDTITIFGHMFPDGDCYGSEIGLKQALLHFYPDKKVYAIGGGFKRIPSDFPGFDEVDDETIKNSLGIAVDIGDTPRLNDKRILTAKERIKVDHHIFTEKFCDLESIEDDRVAACEIISNLFLYKFGYLPKEAAEPLYLGITTDSGRFLYSPVDEKLFKTVSDILKSNVDTKRIYDALYTVDPESLKFKAYVYQNFKIDSGVAYMVFTKEILKELNIEKNQAAPQVNLIGNLLGCYAWVFFAEGEDGMVRVELRSSGFPIQPVAVYFGGGGHLQASGCVLDDINKYQQVIDKIKKNYRSYKNED